MAFQQPITEDKLHVAVWCGKKNKAPGLNGVPTDIFQLAWTTIKDDLLQIINGMYMDGDLPLPQKMGVVVYVPKTTHPMVPEEY
jgi:hypothetical protein